jgi:hypothetical protein
MTPPSGSPASGSTQTPPVQIFPVAAQSWLKLAHVPPSPHSECHRTFPRQYGIPPFGQSVAAVQAGARHAPASHTCPSGQSNDQ